MSRIKKINIDMGNRVKELRAGRQQTIIATTAGITQGMWSKVEDGNLPDIDILYRISKALGTSLDYLWNGGVPLSLVKEPEAPYQQQPKHPKDLQHIIDEWGGLCETQKQAVISVLDAFSKQTPLSLEVNGTDG